MFNGREHWGGWGGEEGKVMLAVHGEVIERIWMEHYLLYLGG